MIERKSRFIGYCRPVKNQDEAIDFINEIPGVDLGHVNHVSLPRLEKGGILKKGQVGLLEGNGAEAVVPLENNHRWTRAVARDMDAALGGSGSQTVELLQEMIELQERMIRLLAAGQQIVLNDREVGRVVRSYA